MKLIRTLYFLPLLFLIPAAFAGTQTQVERGQYLATAGDCISCHTGPSGKPFAGGLKMKTPFGYLLTPNITPDVQTGIGSWSEEDFFRAIHDGVNKHDQDLFPAMPFVAGTKVSREDVNAIYAYIQTIPAVSNAVSVNHLDFPFNIRKSMFFWRELFFTPGFYQPDTSKSASWNRGAYLVEGLGHCSDCHSPRDVLGGIKQSKAFTGALIDGWFALNLTSNITTGLGAWSASDSATYLKTGAYPGKTTALGPMAEVVHNSTSHLTDDDLLAMATYLKTLPANSSLYGGNKKIDLHKLEGARLYIDNCSGCHQSSGRGVQGVIPPLAGNPAVIAPNPGNIIKVVLNGVIAQNNYIAMPEFGSKLTDVEIAELVNYARTSWGNAASADVTASMVAKERRTPKN